METFVVLLELRRVAPTAAELFWNWISSDEQRRRRALFLPIEFSNIDIDELGLIYAVVSDPAGG